MSHWKYPGLLLLGVGVSNIGAWVYFISLNLIVLERTGSAFAVSVLYILLPISALLTSLWSGSVIDRINQRRLLVLLDVARAILVFSLTLIDSLFVLYVLVFILNIGNTLFETSSLIYMTKLVPENSRQRFNALKNFIQSAGFILGPSIAGFLFLIGSPKQRSC
ncbi:MFS transporter [Exiguobacterium sp. SL14]|nr:MFS transporter [Exiguobacterium sp. SL14]MCY1691331.1 MFS transporter [Exiguobacterium sp. SL14]